MSKLPAKGNDYTFDLSVVGLGTDRTQSLDYSQEVSPQQPFSTLHTLAGNYKELLICFFLLSSAHFTVQK